MKFWDYLFSNKPVKKEYFFGTAYFINKKAAYENTYKGLHRLDGPALDLINGEKEYWINGKALTKDEFFTKQSIEAWK